MIVPSRLVRRRCFHSFARAAVLGLALLGAATRPARAATPPEFAAIDALSEARRFAEAESLATRLVARLESARPLDSLALAGALSRYAEARGEQGRRRGDPGIAAALRSARLLESLHAPGFVNVRMRVIAGIMLYDTSLRDSAIAVLRDAVERTDRSGTAPDSMVSHWQLTLGRMRAGTEGLDRGLPHLWRALMLAERRFGPDHPMAAVTLDYLGMAYATNADYDSSRVLLERARRILETFPGSPERALGQVLNSLATLERMQGNIGESVDLLQRALEISRRVDGDSALSVARIRTSLALRLGMMNDMRAAARMAELAIPALERTLGAESFTALNNRVMLANIRASLGDTLAALRELEAARSLMRGRPDLHRRNRAYADHVHAQLAAASGDPGLADSLLRAAFTTLRSTEDPRGSARAECLATAFDRVQGAAERARCDSLGRLYEALADSTTLRATSVWMSSMTARTRAEARVGDLDAAWAHAVAVEATAWAQMVVDARSLSEARALDLANQRGGSLDVLVEAARVAPERRAHDAWDRVVRWRGLVRDEIARLRAPRGMDAGGAAAHGAWVRAQRRYARLVVSGDSDENALESARRDAEERERRWLRVSGTRTAPAPDSVRLDDVTRSLAPGDALVAFFETHLEPGHERLVAFVARAGGAAPAVVDLGPSATVRDAVARWRASLGESPASRPAGPAGAEAACRRLGREVRTLVWEPIVAAAGSARALDIVGDGPVTDLPWQALPDGAGYLAEAGIAVHPIESERDRLASRAAAAGSALLAVGDPDFQRRPDGAAAPLVASADPARDALPECIRANGVALEALPSARAEAADVAERWRAAAGPEAAKLLVGGAATEAAFKREAPAATVIHLATHGIVIRDTCGGEAAPGTRGVGAVQPVTSRPRARRPAKATASTAAAQVSIPQVPALPWANRRVWLAFAGAGRPPAEAADENEGWLTAEEVATLDLSGVEWVVLSACHSGLAQSWTRDGSLGMRRAFEMAGARSVIASQWAVEDAATREWMSALHGARAAGVRHAGEAVRAADRAVLKARRASGRSTHPFYWAAFAATGE